MTTPTDWKYLADCLRSELADYGGLLHLFEAQQRALFDLKATVVLQLADDIENHARALAESLETRGFHPTAPRAVRDPLRFGWADALGLALAVGVTSAAALARGAYVLYGAELYYSPGLRPLYAFVRAWM